jgi:hypothetical protein
MGSNSRLPLDIQDSIYELLNHLGMSGEQAVTLIRSKRQGALYNKVFANYLMTLPEMHVHEGDLI